MMLAKRIIPTLLRDGDKLVKGEKFNGWRSVGHARQAVRVMAQRGVDEMVLLDITATPQGRRPDPKQIREYADECFMPLTIGGGIHSLDDIKTCLDNGADKVCIRTALFDNCGKVVTDASNKYGRQAVVVAIDYHESERANVPMMAQLGQARGAGEIILTCIDREGTTTGYDIDTIKAVSEAVTIPVIAHGGCSGYEDAYQAIKAGADAVAAGALFQFCDATPKGMAKYLFAKGVEVRL
jgi:cyclase